MRGCRSACAFALALLFASVSSPAPAEVTKIIDLSNQALITDIAAEPSGAFYVYDDATRRISRYTAAGVFERGIGPASRVTAISADASGNLFVAQGGGAQVVKYSPAGTELARFDVGNGQVTFAPDALATEPDGKFWAAQRWSPSPGNYELRLGRYSTDGAPLETIALAGEFTRVDLATDPVGNVYLFEESSSTIRKFAPDGRLLASAGGYGTGPGQIASSAFIAVDGAGNMYVSDGFGARIQKFAPDGTFLGVAQPTNASSYVGGGPISFAGPSLLYSVHFLGISRIEQTIPQLDHAVAWLSNWAGITVTDRPTTLQAIAYVPFGDVPKYQWDMDGNGSFDLTTTTGVGEYVYKVAGVFNAKVRATGSTGATAERAFDVRVWPGPPTGRPGVSINDGAKYTNDPRVTLSLVWPLVTKSVLVSNDGGFGRARRLDLAAKIPWTIESSGPERLPKTVYVSYERYRDEDKNFTDDIILDETAPTVLDADVLGGGSATAAATRTKLRIRARDNVSGVAKLQVTNKRRRPGKLRRFHSRPVFRGKASPIFVRVCDRAGNFSRWRRAG